jgi:septum formation protein
MTARLILASGSAIRRSLLRNAGLDFEVEPAQIDERSVTAALEREHPDSGLPELASRLAEVKAMDVSRRHPDALVIGADQMLDIDGRLGTKAGSRTEARRALQQMRGRAHQLHSGVALVENGGTLWRSTCSATLTMRNFSDAWLDSYLDRAGDAVLTSVGSYQLEGLGIQLFEQIEGDYFTILGLPLLPVLAKLRELGVIAS